MTPSVGSLPDGTKGFDVNLPVDATSAKVAASMGYAFAVRYVRRGAPNPKDITAGEMAGLLEAGLGLMLVQHVAKPPWTASADLGRQYGQTAALEAARAGYPRPAHLWCDLEEVDGTRAAIIGYCNAWCDAVALAGFRPGLYVGYGARLTPDQLYRSLHFSSYWSAYNLNHDEFPAVRGVMMRQGVATKAERFPLVAHEESFGVDVIHADAFGDSPSLLLPSPSIV